MEQKSPGPRETEAPNVQLAGERSKPTNQHPQPQPPLDPVSVFAPWCGEEERGFRLRLHKAATIAVAKAQREGNGRARQLYWLAAETAGYWVFRRVEDFADLERILRALNQMFLAADNLRQAEGPDGE